MAAAVFLKNPKLDRSSCGGLDEDDDGDDDDDCDDPVDCTTSDDVDGTGSWFDSAMLTVISQLGQKRGIPPRPCSYDRLRGENPSKNQSEPMKMVLGPNVLAC